MTFDERLRDRLARVSMIVMAVALFWFVGYGVHEAQRAEDAARRRDEAVAALTLTNDRIVAKLTDIFTKTLEAAEAAKAAGTVPAATVEQITKSLEGYVDPALVERAVVEATKAVKGTPGPPGPTGPAGPPGPPASAATTTTTLAATTTTTVRPVPPKTTPAPTPAPTTTTTTRPCAVNLLGLIKAGCGQPARRTP